MQHLSAEERQRLAVRNCHRPDNAPATVSTGDLLRLLAQVEALERESERYRLALEGLTPGGSEFHRDPERCVAEIQRQKDCVWKFATQTKRQLNALEQALSIAPEEAGRIMHAANAETYPDPLAAWRALSDWGRDAYTKYAAALLAELQHRAGMGE